MSLLLVIVIGNSNPSAEKRKHAAEAVLENPTHCFVIVQKFDNLSIIEFVL